MASSVGIHIDRHRYRLVALEGGLKKHRIAHHVVGEIPPGEDPVTAVSQGLRRALKKAKVSNENVGLAIDSGRAAFRALTLPFDDRTKIEEVLKFEIEADLPQWDIDDVVVDFLVTDFKPGVESHLIVTAVPKDQLESSLLACERSGLEASEAELEGSALFNAAYEAGIVREESAQVLVHVGDASTTVVVADGGMLSTIRSIRAGAFAGGLEIAPDAADAGDGEEAAAADEEDPLAGTTVETEPLTAEQEAERAKRLAETVRRIRRELGRTVSGARTQFPIEGIFVCGSELPDLFDEEMFDLPVSALDVLPEGEELADASELVVAYGAALHQMGGGLLDARLRREELRFTGTFERLELPLAVASLLAFFTLLVMLVVTNYKIKWGEVGEPGLNQPGDMQIWLEASNGYMLPDPEEGYPGRLKNPSAALKDFAKQAERGEITDRTKFEQLDEIRKILEREIYAVQRDLGVGEVSEVGQPQSALQGAAAVLGLLESLGEQVGRFGLRSVQANYVPGRGGSDDNVIVKLDIDFFAQDDLVATGNYTTFVNAVQERPWCTEFQRKPTKVLEAGDGIYVDGLTIQVDTSKIEKAQG